MTNCERFHAEFMARFAGITLRPEQIDDYTFARNCQDKEFMGECDQVILDMCLDDQQTIIFRKKFDNIFYGTPTESRDNQ